MPHARPRTERLTPELARWLVGAHGRSVTARAREYQDRGESELRLVTRLRDGGVDAARASAAMSAAEARRRMPAALVARGDLVFTRAALEQATHPDVAAWRARRFSGRRVADLGCGAGGDLLALARTTERVVGVDRDEARAVLAAHNLTAAGADTGVVVGDARRAPVRADAIHADPSRRSSGRRARWLAAYEPPVPELLQRALVTDLGVAVSPAVDWADPDLPDSAEVEFVQVGWDLIEAVLWIGALRRPGARATATILGARGPVSRSRGETVEPAPVGEVGDVIIEAAPAAVRARLHDDIAAELGAWRLARTRALLTARERPATSPWWRSWTVEATLAARPKAVRGWLRDADERPVEIATAGLDADPEEWWRQLGRPPRGPQGRRILLVRLDAGATALVLIPDN